MQLIAPGNVPVTKDELATITKTITHMKETKEDGLRYVRLDKESVRMVLLTDASFANARGFRSQLGFLILLVDNRGHANIVHYASQRCKRVTRSVMASELHALVAGFDAAFWLCDLVNQILGRDIPIEAYVDSKTVFDVVAKDGVTTEKRLEIDIHALREAYANGEISRLGWLPGGQNAADGLTKDLGKLTTKSPLWNVLHDKSFGIHAQGWVTKSRKNGTPLVSTKMVDGAINASDWQRFARRRPGVVTRFEMPTEDDGRKGFGNDG